jgi:hypothetical protein
MYFFKNFILMIFIIFTLSGCLAELSVVSTAAGAAMTAQEVEEEHNGDFWQYTKDKANSLYNYLEEKLSNEHKDEDHIVTY